MGDEKAVTAMANYIKKYVEALEARDKFADLMEEVTIEDFFEGDIGEWRVAAMRDYGVCTAKEFLKLSQTEISRIPRVGTTGLRVIKEFLGAKGIPLM